MLRPSSGAHASTVQRPSRRAIRADQRIPLRLAHAGQVLAVDEQPDSAELFLGEQAEDDVRLAAIGDTDSLRAAARRCSRTRRRRGQRLRVPTSRRVPRCGAVSAARRACRRASRLERSHVGVGRRQRIRLVSDRAEQFDADIASSASAEVRQHETVDSLDVGSDARRARRRASPCTRTGRRVRVRSNEALRPCSARKAVRDRQGASVPRLRFLRSAATGRKIPSRPTPGCSIRPTAARRTGAG